MNLAQLRAFHAVAVRHSFSAAALTLGVSQPAVTQHIKSLEAAIGARLFHRLANGVELTPDGAELLPKVRQAVLILDDLAARMNDGRDLRSGHLSLGLCAPYVAMPILDRFAIDHPGVRLDVRLDNSSRLVELVSEHRLDIALATLQQPDPDLACERLIDQEVLILVNADHPWWEIGAVPVEALQGERWVSREAGSMTRRLFETALAARSVEILPALVLGSREAVKEAVAVGLGVGIVLDRELGHDPRLRGVRVTGADMTASEYLITRPEARKLGAVREFIEIARALFGRVPVG
jgi:aminoethylphosphonate catabolism LysR family transcriptional regulator